MRREAIPRRSTAGLVTLAALVGAWMGHTAGYLHVEGGSGLQQAPLSGVHVSMLALGAALALVVTLAGARCRRTWVGLGHRLDAARATLRRAWRGERAGRAGMDLGCSPARVSTPSRWAALWLLLISSPCVRLGVQLWRRPPPAAL